MSDKTRKIAVLTGDLVNSTGLGPEKVERAFMALEDCAEMQAEWMGGQSLHFTRHRGDGWQVALAEPKYALRSALCFRAALRALGEEFDSYIGIAEGDVEGEIGPDLNEETATVFAQSGEELEDLKTSRHFRMAHHSLQAIDAAIILADSIFQNWTPTQAETMKLAMSPEAMSFSQISEILKKSRQTVTKTLKAASYEHVILALETLDGAQSNA
ncbi:hypothetical protein HCZ23_16765 [Celeribacter sp. HF31]|uniref:hypothetical protein n=1 Tax=Celeribacter sp. HF31 TaxID=2721558 RepID=UPI0014301523|nr:hypothetical protein [Celeribacter sp. HF31]NIY81116.1 hypothetical protein [Celeribacter sp. HF31]